MGDNAYSGLTHPLFHIDATPSPCVYLVPILHIFPLVSNGLPIFKSIPIDIIVPSCVGEIRLIIQRDQLGATRPTR